MIVYRLLCRDLRKGELVQLVYGSNEKVRLKIRNDWGAWEHRRQFPGGLYVGDEFVVGKDRCSPGVRGKRVKILRIQQETWPDYYDWPPKLPDFWRSAVSYL